MLDEKQLEIVKTKLFSGETKYLYAVVDGASCPELRFKIYDWEPLSSCLWSGSLEPDLEEVAPYMILLERDHVFTDWILTKGWGNNWNIFVASDLDFKGFRKQIRKLQKVRSPEGKSLIFRFYDPRVIEIFLPTCDTEQLSEFFENVKVFYNVDSNTNELLVNRLEAEDGSLQVERFEISE